MSDIKKLVTDQKRYIKQVESHLRKMSEINVKLKSASDSGDLVKVDKLTKSLKRYEVLFKVSSDKLSAVEGMIRDYKLVEHKRMIAETQTRHSKGKYDIRRKSAIVSEGGNVVVNSGSRYNDVGPLGSVMRKPANYNKVGNIRKRAMRSTDKVRSIASSSQGVSNGQNVNSTLYNTVWEDIREEGRVQTDILYDILNALTGKGSEGKQAIQADVKAEIKAEEIKTKNSRFKDMMSKIKTKFNKDGVKNIGGGSYVKKLIGILGLGAGAATLYNFKDEIQGVLTEFKRGMGDASKTVNESPFFKDTFKSLQQPNLVDPGLVGLNDKMGANIKKGTNLQISKDLYDSDQWKKAEKVIKERNMVMTEGWSPDNGLHKKGSAHHRGIALDFRTRFKDDGNAQMKSDRILMDAMALFNAGATKIVFEYDNNTSEYVVKNLREATKDFNKPGSGKEFYIRKTKGTGEHLDVVFGNVAGTVPFTVRKDAKAKGNYYAGYDSSSFDSSKQVIHLAKQGLKANVKKVVHSIKDFAHGWTPEGMMAKHNAYVGAKKGGVGGTNNESISKIINNNSVKKIMGDGSSSIFDKFKSFAKSGANLRGIHGLGTQNYWLDEINDSTMPSKATDLKKKGNVKKAISPSASTIKKSSDTILEGKPIKSRKFGDPMWGVHYGTDEPLNQQHIDLMNKSSKGIKIDRGEYQNWSDDAYNTIFGENQNDVFKPEQPQSIMVAPNNSQTTNNNGTTIINNNSNNSSPTSDRINSIFDFGMW